MHKNSFYKFNFLFRLLGKMYEIYFFIHIRMENTNLTNISGAVYFSGVGAWLEGVGQITESVTCGLVWASSCVRSVFVK